MKSKSIVLAGVLVAFSVSVPVASAQVVREYMPLKYYANEFSMDLFGTVSAGKDAIDPISARRIKRDGRMGLGLGANYFATPWLGIGGDAYSENTSGRFVDNTSGSVILRLPLEALGLAPYGFGGGGYQFDPVDQWTGHAGAGVEFRCPRRVGIFADGRYVFADKTRDYGLARLGLRYSF